MWVDMHYPLNPIEEKKLTQRKQIFNISLQHFFSPEKWLDILYVYIYHTLMLIDFTYT